MATSMNTNSQEEKSPVGLLLIIGDILSNEQRDELCLHLRQAFGQIDHDKYHEINDLFNNLLHENEFHADSQYRQVANTENGSLAGFLYLPSFHTLLSILREMFQNCYHVCLIFCGQQVDSNGALVLSDSTFTCENFASLFDEHPSYLVQDLQLILPFVSNQWMKLSNDYLQKQIEHVQIDDLSKGKHEESSFGQLLYERISQVLTNEAVSFDIYTKLTPRDSAGTIAFDEPNLYILYGQQGEASLFGVRGFVVLINGGFSRSPSYWNLIRGLQNIDACILTHFDHDALPGMQTILHRKTIPPSDDEQLCKPDIGAVFLNHTQRLKLQSADSSKTTSKSKLLVHLNENIDQFLNDIQQLHIDTFDLVKHTNTNKSLKIEPINLFKKIAFGSLDLYVLHPTGSATEDEKMIATLQKIPIHQQQPSASIVPLHHWYSSCSLLVWTPNSKSNRDSLVRILYTGACPQTLVFEALSKVRHLECLHEFEEQNHQQSTRTTKVQTTSSSNNQATAKQTLQKPKVSLPINKRVEPSTAQSKTGKVPSRPAPSKLKTSQTLATKSEKPQPVAVAKKTPPPTNTSSRPANKDKKVPKPGTMTLKSSTKLKEVKNQVQKPKPVGGQKKKIEVPNGHQESTDARQDAEERQVVKDDHEQKLESQNEHVEESTIDNDHKDKSDTHEDDQQSSEDRNEYHPESVTHSDYKVRSELHENHQPALETENAYHDEPVAENEHESLLEAQNEYHPESSTHSDYKPSPEVQEDHESALEGHNGYHDEQERKSETEDEDHAESVTHADYKAKSEVQEDHQSISETEHGHPEESDIENEHEHNDEHKSEAGHSENEQSNDFHQNSSLENDKEESAEEKNERKLSAELDHEDDIKRPESVSLPNNHHSEPFVESNTASPIKETEHPSGANDPMTTSFVDGIPNTQNPFTATADDVDDDDMEIIHHDISTSDKHSMPPVEEIHPQGLPIDNHIRSKQQSKESTRTNRPSKLANTTTQASSHQSRQTTSSSSIFTVDVAYIPYHGNEHYVDSEFFRRVRARYYVLNAVQIHRRTLESLIEGKEKWQNKEHVPVTLVPTFDGEPLRQFFVMNKTRLAELNINILPAATRCNVQYDDEGSPAQRLRFSSLYDTDEQ